MVAMPATIAIGALTTQLAFPWDHTRHALLSITTIAAASIPSAMQHRRLVRAAAAMIGARGRSRCEVSLHPVTSGLASPLPAKGIVLPMAASHSSVRTRRQWSRLTNAITATVIKEIWMDATPATIATGALGTQFAFPWDYTRHALRSIITIAVASIPSAMQHRRLA